MVPRLLPYVSVSLTVCVFRGLGVVGRFECSLLLNEIKTKIDARKAADSSFAPRLAIVQVKSISSHTMLLGVCHDAPPRGHMRAGTPPATALPPPLRVFSLPFVLCRPVSPF